MVVLQFGYAFLVGRIRRSLLGEAARREQIASVRGHTGRSSIYVSMPIYRAFGRR